MANEIKQTAIHRLRIDLPDPDPEPEHPEWEYPTWFEADWEPKINDKFGTREYWRVTGSDSGNDNYLLVYPSQIDGLIELLQRMKQENR